MTTDYEIVRDFARMLINREIEQSQPTLTEKIISKYVDQALQFKPEWVKTIDRNQLIKELETIYAIFIGEARTLEGKDDHIPWLQTRISEISWQYWNRYNQYLIEKGWADEVLKKLNKITDEILGRMEDPARDSNWDRRGMVVGHVQSGKTANYIGLICKAADAGYKVIIVLAGAHNSLRSQTQMRIDEGFVGYDSKDHLTELGHARLLGVGKIDPSAKRPGTVTTRLESGDFKQAVAQQFHITPGGNPLVFVVKKNASVLKHLIDWVQWAADGHDNDGHPIVTSGPLLLIDDEADYASVDTKKLSVDDNGLPDPDHDPSVINKYIRTLLFSFKKCAYVGYTATPFANIFIMENAKTKDLGEDLFPRSFIMTLPTPSNYVSPSLLFGINGQSGEQENKPLPIIRIVSDHAETLDPNERLGWIPSRHSKAHVPLYKGQDTVPPSLHEAVCTFVLTCAARIARGQINKHNSMLIHTSRYVDVQTRVSEQVLNDLIDIQNLLKMGSGESLKNFTQYLQQLWETDFIPTTQKMNWPDCHVLSWADIQPCLVKVSSSIKVKQINGSAADVLDYYENQEKGLNVIVVGGDKLSRGLTLEGLSVSYFLRASRMYDTLMQMGRWFGYRPGYGDLCRLYSTSELVEWLEYIALADGELRQDFDHMMAVGGTPIDYGHKVLCHPKLMVTSQVKMRHGIKLKLSFSGHISETTTLFKDIEHQKENIKATVMLISGLSRIKPEINPVRNRPSGKQSWEGGICWSNIEADKILSFLQYYKTHDKAYEINSQLIHKYISKQVAEGYLTHWTVFMPSGKGNQWKECPVGTVNMIQRDWSNAITDNRATLNRIIIRRIVSPRDETIDLDMDSYKLALDNTKNEYTKNPGRYKSMPDEPSGRFVRDVRSAINGLLIIYPLDPAMFGVPGLKDDEPVIGFAISFPGNMIDDGVEYMVNNIYYSQEIGIED